MDLYAGQYVWLELFYGDFMLLGQSVVIMVTDNLSANCVLLISPTANLFHQGLMTEGHLVITHFLY